MTNQIPEEDRKKIESKAETVCQCGMTVMQCANKRHYLQGASFGYTLGLQSAEKRVKELEDVMQEFVDRVERGEIRSKKTCKV